MAGKSLESLMGYVPLMGVVQATTSGIPNPLPPALMRRTQEVVGDAGSYARVTGERRLASTAQYGSSAKSVGLREVARIPVKLIHSYEKQPLQPLVLQQLMSFDKYEQDKGAAVIAHNVKSFAKRAMNLRIAAAIMVLGTGVIYRDASGFVLPTSSGAAETLSFQVAASHQGQLNDGTSTIIGASWATATTDIPSQLVALQERAAQEHGYPLKLAFYGKNIPAYLTKNDFVIDYLARTPEMSVQWLKNPGQIPQGLFGYTWIPMLESHFKNEADDTTYSLWDGDKIVFTPDVQNGAELEDWWGWAEGSMLIPNSVDLQTTMQSLDKFRTEYGMFAYGQLAHDPPGLVNYQGDTFLPLLRNPNVIYQADVTP